MRGELDAIVSAIEIHVEDLQVWLARRLGAVGADRSEDVVAVIDAGVQCYEVKAAVAFVRLLEEASLVVPGRDVGANVGRVRDILFGRCDVCC